MRREADVRGPDSARGGLDERDEPRADRVGLVVGRRLDHHADELLGAAGAHEDAAAALERRRSRARSRRASSRAAIAASRSATRTLTSCLRAASRIAVALGEVAAVERLERQQRGWRSRRRTGTKPMSMMWPDCSPPSAQPRSRSSSST